MKYVKTFESFKSDFDSQNKFNFNTESLNENLLDDIMDFFRNIWDHITEKAQDFVDFIGDKWNEFKNKINEISESVTNLIGDKLGLVLKNVEKLFGKPANDLTIEDIKNGLKNMPKVQTLSSTNEEKEPGQFSEKDPLVQKVLAILEGVFLVNMVSCFAPLAWILGFFVTGGIVSGMFSSLIISYLAIGIFTTIRNMLYKSAEKTKEKIKDPAFLRKKEELIDYMTGTDTGWKLGAIMSKGEPGFADITQDGELDTEMMTFKKGDILIFSGVSFYSSGEIKYVTTVRNLNGDILLEPFLSKDVEELNYSIRKTIESGIKQQPTKINMKTYGGNFYDKELLRKYSEK
jgi:hypothetical protein